MVKQPSTGRAGRTIAIGRIGMSQKYTRPFETRTGVSMLSLMRLLERLFRPFGNRREGKLVVERPALESFGELRRRRDDERRAFALDQSLAGQPAEHERDRFARRADELAQQAVALRAENDPAVFAREGVVARHANERGDESLLDAESRELAQLVEQRGALRHQLIDEDERVLRLLADEGAEAGGAEKERLAFFIRARVGDVARVLREPLGAEGLAGRCDPGDRKSTRMNSSHV